MAVGGNTAYDGITDLPPLVRTAVELARSQDFDNSCEPAQGRLPSVLARGNAGGLIGETGTGCGIGLAWMLDTTGESTSIVSVELDSGPAAASAALFAGPARPRTITPGATGSGIRPSRRLSCDCHRPWRLWSACGFVSGHQEMVTTG
jgi:hypothetical protein